jgi:hypothetical protein
VGDVGRLPYLGTKPVILLTEPSDLSARLGPNPLHVASGITSV